MPTARLPDGTEVDTASPAWRDHCLREWKAKQPTVDRHVATLKRISGRQERADYIANVERTDGPSVAERVRIDYGTWFEAEKTRRANVARRSTPTG
jgi:hypothetical protein